MYENFYSDNDTAWKVSLPGKLGTQVWYVDENVDDGVNPIHTEIYRGNIVCYNIDSHCIEALVNYDGGLTYWHRLSDFGTKVFLSKQEAELNYTPTEHRTINAEDEEYLYLIWGFEYQRARVIKRDLTISKRDNSIVAVNIYVIYDDGHEECVPESDVGKWVWNSKEAAQLAIERLRRGK